MAWLLWWEQLTGATCPGCGQPLNQPVLCADCRALLVPRHLPRFVYLGDYRRFGRLARAVKYQGQRALAELLGQRIALGVEQAGWRLEGVTAVPTLLHRKVQRGYNQAELLAKSAARELHLPYQSVLERTLWDISQTKKTLQKRLELAEATFRPNRRVQGVWLLVDDVLTTGTTFIRARKALLEAGAAGVYGAAIAVKSPHELSQQAL
ncbi:MAG: ComF family protein [Meiothermus sp.]|uniref:ComF family protein n=1 Tax=Meiothermus sp. TaxID=1955249 RepID=UPI00298F3D34|nr:ComF family protein [Meiothermus sp.]MCX7600963.1 ComF family protein [Meiothermus sp.]MDW8426630.1 ComF family protein [Meiothermus sp.]